MERNQNIDNGIPAFRLLQLRESRFGCPRIARVTSSEDLGTMSKNNLTGITLRVVFTSDGVVVGVVIRSVERYGLVKIKPTESEAEH